MLFDSFSLNSSTFKPGYIEPGYFELFATLNVQVIPLKILPESTIGKPYSISNSNFTALMACRTPARGHSPNDALQRHFMSGG